MSCSRLPEENPYQIREERVRFEPGPRFWGTYSPCPPVSGAPTKEPFSSPPAQFLSRLGHWGCGIHQCRGPAQSVLDRSDHLRAPRTTRRLLHGTNGSQSVCPGARVPARAENPGFDSPLLCWAGRLRNLPVPVCSGLDLHLHPLPACPPAHELSRHCAVRCTSRLPLRKPCALGKRNPLPRASSPFTTTAIGTGTIEPRPLYLSLPVLRQLSCASACTPSSLHCVTSPGRAPSGRRLSVHCCPSASRHVELNCARLSRNIQRPASVPRSRGAFCFGRRLRKAPDPASSSTWISRSPSAKHLPLRPRWPSPMPSPSRTMRTTSELFSAPQHLT